jgi:hypothetical protein
MIFPGLLAISSEAERPLRGQLRDSIADSGTAGIGALPQMADDALLGWSCPFRYPAGNSRSGAAVQSLIDYVAAIQLGTETKRDRRSLTDMLPLLSPPTSPPPYPKWSGIPRIGASSLGCGEYVMSKSSPFEKYGSRTPNPSLVTIALSAIYTI